MAPLLRSLASQLKLRQLPRAVLVLFVLISSNSLNVKASAIGVLDAGIFLDAGKSCATSSSLGSLLDLQGKLLPGSLQGPTDQEDWYSIQLQRNWKFQASLLNEGTHDGVALALYNPGCTLKDSAPATFSSIFPAALDDVVDENGTWHLRIYLENPADSGGYAFSFRVNENFVGGDMVKIGHFAGDGIRILGWTGQGESPLFTGLRLTFNLTSYSNQSLIFQLLNQTGAGIDVVIIDGVARSLAASLTDSEITILQHRLSQGTDLIIFDPELINSSSLFNIPGIKVDSLTNGSNSVRLLSDVLTYGVVGYRLTFSHGFSLVAGSNSKAIGLYESNRASAVVRVRVGNGNLIAFGSDSADLTQTSTAALYEVVSAMIKNLQDVSAELTTRPIYLSNSSTRYLALLDGTDAVQTTRKSMAGSLNSRGFSVQYTDFMYSVGGGYFSASIDVGGSRTLFESVFKTQIVPLLSETNGVSSFRQSNITDVTIPSWISSFYPLLSFPSRPVVLDDGVWPPPAPTYGSQPKLSPNEAAVAIMHSAASVESLTNSLYMRQTYGINGAGVNVGMIDTGFKIRPHSYYKQYYQSQLASSVTIHNWTNAQTGYVDSSQDSDGHGTAMLSNLISLAQGAKFYLLADSGGSRFSLSLDEFLTLNPLPSILSISLGYDTEDNVISGCNSHIPPPDSTWCSSEINRIAADIQQLVNNDGVTVVMALGNGGTVYWPNTMPEVLSAGGVYWDGANFVASSYSSSSSACYTNPGNPCSSSGSSKVYSGRHVPDVSGLVGPAPHGVYIEMPTPNGSTKDVDFSGYGDGTASNDGWMVASGTSSAAPQIAALAAAIKQLLPLATPSYIKSRIENTARTISTGCSANNECAQSGGKPSGFGLIDFRNALQARLTVISRYQYTYTPIPGDAVTITRLSDLVVVASGYTDSNGQITFTLSMRTYRITVQDCTTQTRDITLSSDQTQIFYFLNSCG